MDDWGQSSRPDRFAGVPSYDETRRPSIEGRDALQLAMADLVPKQRPPKKRHWWWPRWMTWKRAIALVVLDIILGNVAWHYLTRTSPGAVRKALETTMNDAAHNDWSGVYDSLCRNDKAQISESELASAGRGALAQIGFLRKATVESVTAVHQSLGPISVPAAAQVSGQWIPVIGEPSSYTVVLVHEVPGGWHVCLSAGGFSSSALGYSEPIGQGFTP